MIKSMRKFQIRLRMESLFENIINYKNLIKENNHLNKLHRTVR